MEVGFCPRLSNPEGFSHITFLNVIRAIIKTSLIDWDGKITTVLFYDKCNFLCPFCQNWDLIMNPEKYPVIEWNQIAQDLKKKKGWVDGVVLTGGEPLVYKKNVFELCQKVKDLGFAVKLDTNGAYPEIMQELINKKLVDYVAMDIKAPLDKRYHVAAGKKIDIENIKKSKAILMSDLIDYEFRTTCVPGIIDENAIHEIGKVIKGAKKWALQAYIPDNAYKKEYRKKLGTDYILSLEKFQIIAKKYVSNVILRGKT
jgi:pyruvate formate lyase activating enzyme